MLIKNSKHVNILGIEYSLRIVRHLNDSGRMTLSILLRGQDKNKDKRFYYFNNGNGVRIYEQSNLARRTVSNIREAKLFMMRFLTNTK